MTLVCRDWRQALPEALRGGAASVGNFDGVHLGHAALIAELRRQATRCGGPAVALTFDPHPLDLLRPDRRQPLLTTLDDRSRLLHELGADHVVVLRTTTELLNLSAAEFFTAVIQEQLGARALAEGTNFGFGRNREGTVETLAELCRAAGLSLSLVPPLTGAGGEVSSSRVRAALVSGDVDLANQLLGRAYRLHGVVGVGQRRGRTLGFPTANLDRPQTLVPGDGVYAARALVEEGNHWPAAVNVGPNPTFGEGARKIEAHLLGFTGDLYGRSLALDFVHRLRDTRPFNGVAELVEQLRQDVDQVRRRIGPLA
jgi:riboflavin kinase/FMN adenylyltransferase